MADQVGTIDLPLIGGDGDVTVTTESPADGGQDAAPWGYKDDGTPYKRDPSIYARRDGKRRGASAPKAKTAKKPKAKGSPYRDSVLGLFQLVALPVAAAATRSDAAKADLITMDACAEPIAESVDSLAQSNEKVAQALDRLADVGPYGLVIAAVTPMILQIAVNHGRLAPGIAGTVDPAELLGYPMPESEPERYQQDTRA